MTTTTRIPSHKVDAVKKGRSAISGRSTGRARPHADGEGFNLRLDMLPLNGAEIVIRKPNGRSRDSRLTPKGRPQGGPSL